MNQPLRSLEGLGYIARSDAPDQGRARIIRFIAAANCPKGQYLRPEIPVQIRRAGVEKTWEVIDGAGHGNFAILAQTLRNIKTIGEFTEAA
jgi:hypothetical protein